MKAIPFIFFSIIALNTFAQRVVLAELFSNSSCPPCASNTPQITNYVMNNPSNSIAIVYHTNFPYTSDSMYHENPSDNNLRVSYYGVSYAPSTVFEGNQYNGSTSNFLPNMNSTISNRAMVAPEYEITPVYITLNGNTLNISFVFESQGEFTNETLKAHIAVVEETVLKSSYAASPGNNSETEYHYVMRKMLPDANGTDLQNRELNGKDTLTYSWNLEHIKSEDEIRIIAFVQNNSTKEIYQAMHTVPVFVTSVDDVSPKHQTLFVFPNPSERDFIIQYPQILEENLYLSDVNGRTIEPETKRLNADKLHISSENLSQGIYFIHLQTGSGIKTEKIVIR